MARVSFLVLVVSGIEGSKAITSSGWRTSSAPPIGTRTATGWQSVWQSTARNCSCFSCIQMCPPTTTTPKDRCNLRRLCAKTPMGINPNVALKLKPFSCRFFGPASCAPLTPSHFCPLPWRRPFDPDRPSPYPIHHRAAKQLPIPRFCRPAHPFSAISTSPD